MIMANQGMQMMQIYYITITADMIFVKNFTRPEFQAKEFYTGKTHKSQISVMWYF